MLALAASGKAQETARTMPGLVKVLKVDPSIYYRMQRVWYQRRLGIDSAAAMKLVKADEAEKEGSRATFEDASLDIAARAEVLRGLRERRTVTFEQVLSPEQLSQLSGSSSSGRQGTAVNAPHIVQNDTVKTHRLFAIHQAYGKALQSIREDAKLDSTAKQEKIKALREERESQVTAFLNEQAQQAGLRRQLQVSIKEEAGNNTAPAKEKDKKTGKERARP